MTWQFLIDSLIRSSAVAKRPRDAPCRWKFCCHSKSLKMNRIYTVEYGVWKLLLVFNCNYDHSFYCFRDKSRYWSKIAIFCRAILCIARPMPLCGVRLSVSCFSVTFAFSVETNKRIFHIFSLSGTLHGTPFQFFRTKRYGSIPTRTLNGSGLGKNRDSQRISGYRIDDICSAINNCNGRPCNLPHRPPRVGESCLSQPAWTTTTKRI